MPNDTVTLALSGDVPLELFATAMSRFSALVRELARIQGSNVKWIVSDLDVSSAIATARGIPETEEQLPEVHRVVDGFQRVGEALASDSLARLPPAIATEARQLSALIGREVESIRFETADTDVIVTEPLGGRESVPDGGGVGAAPAFGSVEGRVQTLTNRGSLRFTLYDTLGDRAVSCYLREGDEETVREVWGKLAIVEGTVTRDTATARPLAVREITSVRTVAEPGRWAYERARAVVPGGPGGPLPEATIRRLRDAE